MSKPILYILPDELTGGEEALNESLMHGRELARKIKESGDISSVTDEQRTILGLTTLVHVFHEKIEDQTQTLQVAAKDHADAMGRLCRAKFLLDELRKRSKGYAEMKQHQQGAIMMGVVDAMERVLGTTEKPLAAYVDDFMQYQDAWGEPS